ncbi:MAG: flagellar basal-body MS-ring/collar protein FliF [Bryobacteraceae bacterium]
MMNQILQLLSRLSRRQKITLAAAGLAVAGGLAWFPRWNDAKDFRPLYSRLAAEDASSVVSRLRQNSAEYRLSPDGTTILVRSAQVPHLRLQMASAGLPKSGRAGFELFDKTNFGATDFAEQVNYHRALEGELERSVMTLAEVEKARVHLTRPKESLFLENRQPAKASVLLTLRPGVRLSPANVQSITNLLASAVDGLAADAVSVMDTRGNLLNRPRPAPAADGTQPNDAMLEYRQSLERDVLVKINNTLEPLLGADRFRAGVSVECDITSGEQSEEAFDPSKSVMVQSQRTEDLNGAAATSAGIPGTPSNLPGAAPRATGVNGGVARRTENISYQTTRTVRRTRLPQGAVERLSIALLVDHAVRWDGPEGKKKRIVEPLPPERLKSIRDLVAGAVGLNSDRGDQLVVESLPFETTSRQEPPVSVAAPAVPQQAPSLTLPKWLTEAIEKKNFVILGAMAGGLLLALLALAAVAFLWMRRRKRKMAVRMQTAVEGAQAALGPSLQDKVEAKLAEHQALKDKQEQEILASLARPPVTTKKGQVLSKHLSEESKKKPDMLVQLVRTWIAESE